MLPYMRKHVVTYLWRGIRNKLKVSTLSLLMVLCGASINCVKMAINKANGFFTWRFTTRLFNKFYENLIDLNSNIYNLSFDWGNASAD